MAVTKNEYDFEALFNGMVSTLETRFASDVQYSDILDWYDNGGIDKEALGIEITKEQRLILAVYYGLTLTEEQQSILEFWKLQDRTTYDFDFGPCRRNNLVLESGRRSGKSLLGSLIINYEFEKLCRLDSPQKSYGIASSTLISIVCVAPSAEQVSKTIYGQSRAMMYNVPFLRRLIELGKIDPQEKMVKYDEKLLYIYSGNSKSETQVGGSPILVVLDEGALFQDKDGDSNALTLWDNLGAGGLVFHEDAKRVIISSAWSENDVLVQLYKAAKESQSWIGFRLRTWDVNPVHGGRDNPIIDSMYISNRKMAELLYEGIRTASVDAYFNPDAVKASFNIMSDLYARPLPDDGSGLVRVHIDAIGSYIGHTVMHLDPAVTRDNYALAYGHSEFIDGQLHVFIDGMIAWEPTPTAQVSILNVQSAIFQIHNFRPLAKVSSDDKESAETFQRLKGAGLSVEPMRFSNNKQLAIYSTTDTLLNERRLHLPKNSPWTRLLKEEMLKVELIKGMKIDHRPGGCFTGETRIPLLDGTRPTIAELVGKEVWVYSCKQDGTIVPGRARGRLTKYVTKLLDVVLDSGAVIRCTPDHPFMTRSGSYIQAKDIIPGVTRLMPISFKWPVNGGYEKVSGIHPLVLTHHMALGYPNLDNDKVVHHKNHIKTDNRPENLEIVTKSSHSSEHTALRHSTDQSYREKLSAGTIAFNKKESTRQKRSEFIRSQTSEWYRNRARKQSTFRNDATLEDLFNALKAGCSNAHQAATFLGYSRNLVVRLLKDAGYSSWESFETAYIQMKYSVDDVYSTKRDKSRLFVSFEEIKECYKNTSTRLGDVCFKLQCTKDAVLRCLSAHGYKGWEDFKYGGKGSNHKVRAVIPVAVENPVSVYDLEVDEWSNFALASGVFVHNSKDILDCVAAVCWHLAGKGQEDLMAPLVLNTKGLSKKQLDPLSVPDVPVHTLQDFRRDLYGRKRRWTGLKSNSDWN